MKTYVKIGNKEYEALVIGIGADSTWDKRDTRNITIHGGYDTINSLFKEGLEWSVICKEAVAEFAFNEDGSIVLDEFGNPVVVSEIIQETETDCSDFNIRGDLTVHTNGTCTVKMGRQTDLEDAYELLYGGEL